MTGFVNWLSWPVVVLLIAAAGCGGGTDGAPAAPPTAPAPPPPPAPPGQPTGIRVVDVGVDFLVWAWDPVETATGYEAHAFPDGAPPSERPPLQVTVEPTFRANGLEPDTVMGFFVRALRETAGGRAVRIPRGRRDGNLRDEVGLDERFDTRHPLFDTRDPLEFSVVSETMKPVGGDGVRGRGEWCCRGGGGGGALSDPGGGSGLHPREAERIQAHYLPRCPAVAPAPEQRVRSESVRGRTQA